MMKRLAILLALAVSPALAQQPDPAFMQKAIVALQAQRNAALDGQASAEARAAVLTDENAALKKQIEELKAPKSADPATPK